jgi:imidazoleglycerol phosphate synthase glutamine amidotransferase subunit HisH
MLKGVTGALLGATKQAKDAYASLEKDPDFQSPSSWKTEAFTLNDFDLVFLPGGHEKSVRQLIDSERVHELLTEYVPQTKRPLKKYLGAICHGVQVLAFSSYKDGKSVLSDMETTSLQHLQEEGIYQTTRLFLGDYYKTYGAGTPSVQQYITEKLNDPSQFKTSLSFSP